MAVFISGGKNICDVVMGSTGCALKTNLSVTRSAGPDHALTQIMENQNPGNTVVLSDHRIPYADSVGALIGLIKGTSPGKGGSEITGDMPQKNPVLLAMIEAGTLIVVVFITAVLGTLSFVGYEAIGVPRGALIFGFACGIAGIIGLLLDSCAVRR